MNNKKSNTLENDSTKDEIYLINIIIDGLFFKKSFLIFL